MKDKRIDAYIQSASPAAQPVITFLRKLIHDAIPKIEENIKWGSPSFEINGKIVCQIMGYKKHTNLYFVNGKDLEDKAGILEDVGEKSNMRGIKQIVTVADLPEEKLLTACLKEAVAKL